MIRIGSILTGLALLAAGAPLAARGQTSPSAIAQEEAVRRQEMTILLRTTLRQAAEARSQGKLQEAARLYEKAWQLVQQIGPARIDQEYRETLAGFSAVYLQLAEDAYTRANYTDARIRVNRVLRVNPKNREAQAFRVKVEKKLKELEGRMPSKEVQALIPEERKKRVEVGTLVQDGKMLYEMGRYDEAEAKLRKAFEADPNNQAAVYYLRLIDEARYAIEARKRESMAKRKIVEVERAWNPPELGKSLPSPNPYARTNIVHTGPGRRVIYDKLTKIRLDQVSFPGLPLSEVVKFLDDEVKARDPEHKGINFMLAPYVDKVSPQQQAAALAGAAGAGGAYSRYGGAYGAGAPAGQIDPITGLPIQPTTPQQEEFELGEVTVTIDPPLRDLRLIDVLDAITKVADHPIKYEVEEYAVVFARKLPETQQLFTRVFKVNPNAFWAGLQGVYGYQFEGYSLGSSGYGGGGYGGGGYGGGGYGGGGYGGGYGGGGYGGGGMTIPRVDVTGGGGYGGGYGGYGGGYGGGGYGGGGYGGGYGGGGYGGGGYGGGGYGGGGYGGGGGLPGVTGVMNMSVVNDMVRAYFSAAGVDLGGTNVLSGPVGQYGAAFQSATGKAVFFNDRTGTLLVRATLEDLDIIEKAIQALNATPDQVRIEAKFVEIGQNDSKALGFDWFWGNTLLAGGRVGIAGGTQPSFAGRPSEANPMGVFPGTFGVPAATPNSSSDNLLTTGLRTTRVGATSVPAVATITGILTDPQFRVVIRALEQRSGADVMSAPTVTTVSGRQAQIQVIDLQTIVTFNQTGAYGGGTYGGYGGGGYGGGIVTGTAATGTTLGVGTQ